jgi:CheY-like chemotaxis protein
MPIMDGWEFVAALHESEMHVPPVIVLSADADLDAESLPVAATVCKGLGYPETLRGVIRAVTQASGERRDYRARASGRAA